VLPDGAYEAAEALLLATFPVREVTHYVWRDDEQGGAWVSREYGERIRA
jgi:hypothetical protein